MRPPAEFEQAKSLLAKGMSVAQVSAATGIPRPTIYNWRRRGRPRSHRRACSGSWCPPDPATYAYLLGVYLGDGHIVTRKSASIRLYLDSGQPWIVAEATLALEIAFGAPARTYYWERRGRCAVLQLSSPMIPEAFPQHGAGHKHLRRILLEPWQQDLTTTHARELIRGLIHSDGCRCVNRFRTTLPGGRVAEYSYVRYFFSNLSADIKDIFCSKCDQLGIRWSRANPRYVSIHDRRSVALLDEFVGPKS